MKIITLTKDFSAIVDDADYEMLSSYKWHAHYTRKLVYAHSTQYLKNGKFKTLVMHRLIMNAQKGDLVDHRDRNTLNNQRNNLRICTYRQNNANRKSAQGKTSNYLGVSFR